MSHVNNNSILNANLNNNYHLQQSNEVMNASHKLNYVSPVNNQSDVNSNSYNQTSHVNNSNSHSHVNAHSAYHHSSHHQLSNHLDNSHISQFLDNDKIDDNVLTNYGLNSITINDLLVDLKSSWDHPDEKDHTIVQPHQHQLNEQNNHHKPISLLQISNQNSSFPFNKNIEKVDLSSPSKSTDQYSPDALNVTINTTSNNSPYYGDSSCSSVPQPGSNQFENYNASQFSNNDAFLYDEHVYHPNNKRPNQLSPHMNNKKFLSEMSNSSSSSLSTSLSSHSPNLTYRNNFSNEPNSANSADIPNGSELVIDENTFELYENENYNAMPGMQANSPSKNFKFESYNIDSWADLYDSAGNKIDKYDYRVEADKGFFFSTFDDVFVCQKKNHFQISIYFGINHTPKYIKPKMPDNQKLYPVDNCILTIFGVKDESPQQMIPIRQSDSDRKLIPYEPLVFKLTKRMTSDDILKQTKMRLHFSQTTNNNNRKRNRPNPDQRYFRLVVQLQVTTTNGQIINLCSAISERVVVRAVNPGHFKQKIPVDDLKPTIQQDFIPNSLPSNNLIKTESIEPNLEANKQNAYATSEPNINTSFPVNETNKKVFYGNVGINTPNPDEALTVAGNIKLSGNIYQPSDVRIKENIEEIDSKKALENVSKLKIYKYDFKPEFSNVNGGPKSDIGVLAQNLQEVLPDAVIETDDVVLSDGQVVSKLLHVNKERLHMECVGAVIALGDKTNHLDEKIEKIEGFIQETKKSNELNNEKEMNNSKNSYSTDFNYLLKQKMNEAKGVCLEEEGRIGICKCTIFKMVVFTVSFIISLAIIGILVMQVLLHTKYNDDILNKTTDDPIPAFIKYNDTFIFPYKVPPAVVSPICINSSIPKNENIFAKASSKLCRFCCASSRLLAKQSKLTVSKINDDGPMLNVSNSSFSMSIIGYDNKTYLSNQILNSKYNPFHSIILYSKNPYIFVNITINTSCTPPYCVEYQNNNYYFIPISQNVDILTEFNIVFYTQFGFSTRYCTINKNAELCPNSPSVYKYNSSYLYTDILRRDLINLTRQFNFNIPISTFLHVDHGFRSYLDENNNFDVCSLSQSNIGGKIYFYKEYFFRFYRLC